MDFQGEMKRVGVVTQNIGSKIIEAAEKEDIGALRPLAKQMREAMDILNVITLTDRMARAAKNN
jgi:RNase P/RNase MRP subunit p30